MNRTGGGGGGPFVTMEMTLPGGVRAGQVVQVTDPNADPTPTNANPTPTQHNFLMPLQRQPTPTTARPLSFPPAVPLPFHRLHSAFHRRSSALLLQVTTPSGRNISMAVPAGGRPGMKIRFRCGTGPQAFDSQAFDRQAFDRASERQHTQPPRRWLVPQDQGGGRGGGGVQVLQARGRCAARVRFSLRWWLLLLPGCVAALVVGVVFVVVGVGVGAVVVVVGVVVVVVVVVVIVVVVVVVLVVAAVEPPLS